MSNAASTSASRAGPSSREALLDAAEALFAERGYDAVSIRDITGRAGVQLAMASYHFRTKDRLFDEVIARRADALNRSRRDALASVGTASLEAVLWAFVGPYLTLAVQGGPGWASYCQLIAQANSGDRWGELLSRQFDATARCFVDAIHACLPPGAPRSAALRGFVLVIGTMLSAFSGSRRLTRLSEGGLDARDLRATCEAMVPFLAAGIGALAEAKEPQQASRRGG